MNTDQALSISASETGEGAWQTIIAPQRTEGADHWISHELLCLALGVRTIIGVVDDAAA